MSRPAIYTNPRTSVRDILAMVILYRRKSFYRNTSVSDAKSFLLPRLIVLSWDRSMVTEAIAWTEGLEKEEFDRLRAEYIADGYTKLEQEFVKLLTIRMRIWHDRLRDSEKPFVPVGFHRAVGQLSAA